MSRKIAFCLVCILGLSACGFFSEEHREQAASKPAAAQAVTAGQWLDLSQSLYREGKFLESIIAAQAALKLKQDYAEAYNNMGAAYAAMRQWDPAIEADRKAVELKPDMQLARNNLAWALAQKTAEKR